MVEVIEHLENPRHTLRQTKSLLKKAGVIFLATPNASGLYSLIRFFFAGGMAMFTHQSYHDYGAYYPAHCMAFG